MKPRDMYGLICFLYACLSQCQFPHHSFPPTAGKLRFYLFHSRQRRDVFLLSYGVQITGIPL